MAFLIRIFLLLLLPSCLSQFDLNSAKLSFFNSGSKKTFSFSVSEDFNLHNIHSKPSVEHPKMSKAEEKLLIKFLKNNKYCINKNGKLSFKITSKQEKIYDVTFANLIEKNYRAKPIAPTTYFGECLEESAN